MALNLVKRFQFCLNTDDAEIVRLGLDGFAEQIAQNENFALTLAAFALEPSVVDVEFILGSSEETIDASSFPLVEAYLNSSPRLEELFSVWSLLTGRRELEAALTANFLRCFVYILQLIPQGDARYTDITLRVLREHETGLVRQLQSTDNSTIAYTMLLISLCLRSHKSLSEPLLHALLTSFKSLKTIANKSGKLPVAATSCAVVLFGHLFTYLEYSQCLLVVSEEKLLLDLLYHGSLPTLQLLLNLQLTWLLGGSTVFRDHLSFFLNSQTVNKLLNMRSKLATDDFDAVVNPFLRLVVEHLLRETTSPATAASLAPAQLKALMGAVHAVLDNLVPQFDDVHQEVPCRPPPPPLLSPPSLSALSLPLPLPVSRCAL